MSQIPKPSFRHHFRPVAHLRGFCNESGLLWVYDRKGRYTPRANKPENVGWEKHLYSPLDGSEEDQSTFFEDELATDIDGPAGEVLRRLGAGNSNMTDSDRLAIANFVVVQECRVPSVRDWWLAEAQRHMNKSMPLIRRQTLMDRLGRSPTPEEESEIPALYARVDKPWWFKFIASRVRKQGDRLARFAYALIEAPRECDWITNDLGFVRLAQSFSEPLRSSMPKPFGAMKFVMPVSSRFALAISPDHEARPTENFENWAAMINQQLVIEARHFVLSKSYDPSVLETWQFFN